MLHTRKNRSLSDIETDLMNCLLRTPTIGYPWNPADPDTADYHARSDRHFWLVKANSHVKFTNILDRIQLHFDSLARSLSIGRIDLSKIGIHRNTALSVVMQYT